MNIINKNELFLLEEIIKKNFASKYKGSILGIFWSLLKPLFIMILLTIIFSTVFGRINNFPVYYLSGKCIYDFFVFSTTTSMMSIKGNQNILKKTAPPKHIFILGGIFSEFFNFLITLIILFGVMAATNAPFYINSILISIIPIISLILMSTGIGLILSILCVYFTDIQHLWGVITLVIMYSSALFYPMDIIPIQFREYMLLNPLYWIIDQFRHFIMWGTFPNILNIINSLVLSSIILILGVIIFKKYNKQAIMKF